jgi:DNA repair protein RecO (recombination protein O)
MKPSDHIQTIEAVIISHKDFGEADRLVTLFSLENGKIRALAKGVRKIHSRKAAYLEPFMHSRVVLARGKTFWIITQADAIFNNPAIRESLSKTAQAAYVMELADRFSIEGEPDRFVFRLLVDTLKRINDHPDAFNALRFFEMRILDQAGFRPDLINCVSCASEISAQDQFFSGTQGGVLCPTCGVLHNRVRKVSMNTLRFIRHIQRSAYSELEHISIPSKVQDEMAALMANYLSSILERKLNAPDFLKQVNRGM